MKTEFITNKVERSELWNEIYEIVKQIPRKETNEDAVDAKSATTSIENLIKCREKWNYLPELPREKSKDDIYSIDVVFVTKRGTEYQGWVRFDFENFVVKGKTISFDYKDIEKWKVL